MNPTIALLLLVLALIASAAAVMEAHGHSFPGWAGMLISVVLLWERMA